MSAFYVCCIYSSALQTEFYYEAEANTINPDPFWEQSNLGPYCLQYRRPKNINRLEKQTKVVTVEKGLRKHAPI